MRKLYLALLSGLILSSAQAQISAPDTVCRGTLVNYTTGVSATSYAWAPANVDIAPTTMSGYASVSLKAYGQPTGVSMQFDNGTYYAFVTTQKGSLVKLNYGSDPFGSTTPVVYNNVFADSTKGIDIVKDGTNWYGIVVSGKKVYRLSFGTSLGNTPTITQLTTSFLSFYLANPYQVSFVNNGGDWVAFIINHGINGPPGGSFASLTRLDFGTSLANNAPTPNFVNTNGNLNNPVSFALQQVGTDWYMVIVNSTGGGAPLGNKGKLLRAVFGNNLKNASPTVNSLGNPGDGSATSHLLDTPATINLIADCDQFYALVGDKAGSVTEVDFTGNDITGNVSGLDLGDVGIPNCIASSTSPFWYTNTGSTRFCIAATSSDSALYIYDNVYSLPAGSTYDVVNNGFSNTLTNSGNYTTTLHADQGKASGPQVFCKDVYSLDAINLAIKQYDTIMVAKGAKCDVYVWQLNGVVIPGAVTDTLTGLIDQGIYTVIGYKAGCSSFSTVKYFAPTGISSFSTHTIVNVYPNPSSGVFNITAAGVEAKEVTINCYNMVGSLVKSVKTVTNNGELNTSVDLSGLSKGVYQLKLQTTAGGYVQQIVLQ